MARFDASQGTMLVGNKIVKWNRGQLVASLRFLAKRWNWSTKKVSAYFEMLKIEKMATKETQKETGQSLITICNYDNYNFTDEERKRYLKQEGNTMETPWKQEGNKTNIDNKVNKERVTPAQNLENSNLYRKPNIPTLEDVKRVFAQRGGTKDMAIKFYDANSSTGWFYKGSPIIDFSCLVNGYIESWQQIVKNDLNGVRKDVSEQVSEFNKYRNLHKE